MQEVFSEAVNGVVGNIVGKQMGNACLADGRPYLCKQKMPRLESFHWFVIHWGVYVIAQYDVLLP